MGELEEKLGSILNDPQMMQQIMTMAQAMGAQPSAAASPGKPEPLPDMDMGMLQKISGLAKQSGIDQREQALLKALGAYLNSDRIGRLEKAMRAAKMAKLASAALGPGGFAISGR